MQEQGGARFLIFSISIAVFKWPLHHYVPAYRMQKQKRLLFKIDHYENIPMQYTEIFKVVKNENFQPNCFYIFLIFAQNIDCGLEPPRRGGSNEYPQSTFWSKNKIDKIR